LLTLDIADGFPHLAQLAGQLSVFSIAFARCGAEPPNLPGRDPTQDERHKGKNRQ
jgi:hypothetical protein